MKLVYALSLLSFIGLSSGGIVSPSTQARIDDAFTPGNGCVNQMDCHKDGVPTADYKSTSVRLQNIANSGSGCCYTYALDKTGNQDCDGGIHGISHLDMDWLCDSDNTQVERISVDGQVLSGESGYGVDGSTCYTGIKWDKGFDDEATHFYEVCITWDAYEAGEMCGTGTSWYQVKARNAFDFGEIVVPSCFHNYDTCAQQGAGLDPAHECACIEELECPEDNPLCNSIEFVANRLQNGNDVEGVCPEGERCCCHCDNCPSFS
eukprot:405391_1